LTHTEFLDKFRCPISRLVFNEPVIAQDGHIYERDCIEEWFRNKKTSPITRQNLNTNLLPVVPIKNMIDETIKIDPKLRELQYNIIREYYPNRENVMRFLRNKMFDKLLNHINFVLTDTFNDGGSLLKYIIQYKCPTEIFKHIIKNSVDLECPFEETVENNVPRENYETPITCMFQYCDIDILIFLVENVNFNFRHHNKNGLDLASIFLQNLKKKLTFVLNKMEEDPNYTSKIEKLFSTLFQKGCDPNFESENYNLVTSLINSN
jgi:hypothetical protein